MTRHHWNIPAVPPGTYIVTVLGARAHERRQRIRLDLRILGGPEDGRVVKVCLNVPDDLASRPAKFCFMRKARGFLPVIKERRFDTVGEIAEVLVGQTVVAELSRHDRRQELVATRTAEEVSWR